AAAIDSASFADEILVVDSGSSDGTIDIARGKGVRVLARAWTGYVEQKNFAAAQATHDWIFSLDADERIPPALADEIRGILAGDPPYHGYRIPRVTFHLGRWIRTTDFYPDYQTRLYDRRFARWPGRHGHGTAGLTISLMNAWSVGLKFMKLWELQKNPKSQIPSSKSQ